MIAKVFFVLAFVAITLCNGKPVSESTEEISHPQPYEFGYLTNDDYGTTTFRKENSDGKGRVEGTYGYKDLHGIERIVEYVADKHGYRAEIKTNEPGTESQNPADVILHANPIQVEEEPKAQYGAPEIHYDAPAYHYEAPVHHYDAPAYRYEAPAYHYGAPTYHYDAQASPKQVEEPKEAQDAPEPQEEAPEAAAEEEPRQKYSAPAYLRYYKPVQVEEPKPKQSEDAPQQSEPEPAQEEEPKTKYSSTSEEYEYKSETQYGAKEQQRAPEPYYRRYY